MKQRALNIRHCATKCCLLSNARSYKLKEQFIQIFLSKMIIKCDLIRMEPNFMFKCQ